MAKSLHSDYGGHSALDSHQFRAELLFEPLFISREDGWIFETANSLRDENVEAVLHGEHQQGPGRKTSTIMLHFSPFNGINVTYSQYV